MRRTVLAGLALALLLASPALATVPSVISYQGLLTDDTGTPVPDGSYDMTFRIYNVPTGGSPLYNELHGVANAVPVVKGSLSVLLGTLVTLDLPFDVPYWLGISIGRDPELTPRVPLTSAPYSLSLRLPFAGSGSQSTPLLRIANAGTGAAIQADPRLDVGSSASNGLFQLYGNGSAAPMAVTQGVQGLGALFELFDEAGNLTSFDTFDFDGTGGYLSVIGDAGGTKYLVVDGNGDGQGNPKLDLKGSPSEVIINTALSGDASVQLPAASISSVEISNEPGITQGIGASTMPITSTTTFQDMVTTTITTVASGYIVVEASSYVQLTFGTANSMISCQIDETAGGGVDAAHNVMAGFFTTPNFTPIFLPIATRRTYFKTAGTYTFRLEARLEGTSDGTAGLFYPVITAMYVPTAYGSVSQIVDPGDAVDFPESAHAVSVVAHDGSTGAGALVDLRELELKAARAEAAAQAAEARLAEARVREQRAHLAVPARSRP